MAHAAAPGGGGDWDTRLELLEAQCVADPAHGIDASEPLLARARDEGRRDVEARLLFARGTAAHALRDDDAAITNLTGALTLVTAQGDRPWQQRVLHALAAVHGGLGDTRTAIHLLEQEIAVRRDHTDTDGLMDVLTDLAALDAQVSDDLEEVDAARAHAAADGVVLAGLDLVPLPVHHLAAQGRLLRLNGDAVGAVTSLEQALRTGGDQLHPLERATLLAELVRALEDAGRCREALATHREFHAAVIAERTAAARRRAVLVGACLAAERARASAGADAARTGGTTPLRAGLVADPRHDALTGLVNTDGLAVALEARLRDDIRLAYVVVDVRRFTSAGSPAPAEDDVPRRVAELLERATRVGDVVARTGGDAFAVLLVNTSAAEARSVCADIRDRVAAHPWHEVAADLFVTARLGGVMRLGGESGAELVERAVAAHAAAGRGGSDTVRFTGRDDPRGVDGRTRDDRRGGGEADVRDDAARASRADHD